MDRSTNSSWNDEENDLFFLSDYFLEMMERPLADDDASVNSDIIIENKSRFRDQLISKSVRKRKQTKPHFRIPRVVKHDIRRHYSRMLLNIWNSHDPKLFQSFLLTYATKNIVSRHFGTFPCVKSFCGSECENLTTVGINIFAKCMGYVLQLVPDLTIAMSNIEVVSSSSTDSSLVKFRLINSATNVFDFETHEQIRLMEDILFYDCKFVDSVAMDKEFIEGENYTSTPLTDSMRVYQPMIQSKREFYMPVITNHFRSVFGRAPRLNNLRPFSVEINVSMRLNSCFQIEAIEFCPNQ